MRIADDEVIDETFDVSSPNDNIPAQTRWNDRTGDSLANVLFALNEDAVQYDPDLIVCLEM